MAVTYATSETYRCVYVGSDGLVSQGWVMFTPPTWRELDPMEIFTGALTISETEFNRRFPGLQIPNALGQAGE